MRFASCGYGPATASTDTRITLGDGSGRKFFLDRESFSSARIEARKACGFAGARGIHRRRERFVVR